MSPVFARILVCGGLYFCLSSLVHAEDKVLAIVNKEPILQSEVDFVVKDVALENPTLSEERLQRETLDFLIDTKLLSQAAREQKLDEAVEFKKQLAYMRDRLLAQRLLQQHGEKASKEADIKAFYDTQIGGIKPVEQVRAHHVLVESEEDAKKIMTRLKAGEDFEKVAKETSKDPSVAQNGGDLDFFIKGQMVPEFAEAAFALNVGEISAPVKSKFGWHIIRLDEKRMKPIPTLDELKDRISAILMETAQTELVVKIKRDAVIDRKDPIKPSSSSSPRDVSPIIPPALPKP